MFIKKIKTSNLLFKSNVIIPVALGCCFQYAQAVAKLENNTSYDLSKNWSFGVNAIYSKTNLKNNYGGNTFSTKPNLGLNPFVRHMFNSNWGMEFGLETYQNIQRISSFDTNDIMSGFSVRDIFAEMIRVGVVPAPSSLTWRSKIKQRHIYLGGINKIELWKDKSSLNLMLGLSLSNLNSRSELFKYNEIELTPANRRILTYKKTKLIPIVRASFEHQLNSNLKLQALALWKWTSMFKVKSKEEFKVRNYSFGQGEIKLKDSIGLGLGLTYCM